MTVQAQHDTSGSMLSLYRDSLRLRRTLPDLHDPSFAWRGSPVDVLIFDPGQTLGCVINLSDRPFPLPGHGAPLLRRRKKRSKARELLREGLELAHRLGATPLTERARVELAATGARPRRMLATGLESLTPSEHRVAGMAVEGMSNKVIAQSLFVTVKTVEVHLSSVYRKLGITSRTQLARALRASPPVLV